MFNRKKSIQFFYVFIILYLRFKEVIQLCSPISFTSLDPCAFLHFERALAILAEWLLPLELIGHGVLSFFVSLKKKANWQIICIFTYNLIYERNHWGGVC